MSRCGCLASTIALATVAAFGAPPSSALAKEAPIKEIPASHLGREVDKTTKGNICKVGEGFKDECQPGVAGGEAGAFRLPVGVAGGAAGGDVFVADENNNRVEELDGAGHFVSMWGRDVNRKGGDVCVVAEEGECQAGEAGSRPGEFGEPRAISVDPGTGDFYVADRLLRSNGTETVAGQRVQEFTREGKFVLEIGREVNETTKANLCTQAEVEAKGVKCTGPAPLVAGETVESGVFANIEAIAAGGPEDRLYVADSTGVQEFDAEGKAVTEPAHAISVGLLGQSPSGKLGLASLAVDPKGDLFTTDFTNTISTFDPVGKETTLAVRQANEVSLGATAVDRVGRLAVVETENTNKHGTLYEVLPSGLHQVSEFSATGSVLGAGFNSENQLYLTANNPGQELTSYEALPVGELVAREAECKEGSASASDATFECLLNGEVDPWGVTGTEAWFEWGRTPQLGEVTQPLSVATTKKEGEEEAYVKASVALTGLAPNTSSYYYRLAGHDRWVQSPEAFTSTLEAFKTPPAAPRIVGEPAASFVRPSSVVLYGELNPENTRTKYEFQYAPASRCASLVGCAAIQETESEEFTAYGPLATTMEARGLQPATLYRYRLYATNGAGGALNEHGEGALPEGEFTTAAAPKPSADTNGAGEVGLTTATISGTVNPDGNPAIYSFELGVASGPETQYATVFDGSAGAGTAPIPVTAALTGLRPGTTYAYRVTIKGSSGVVSGTVLTFTTQAVPTVPPVPASVQLLTFEVPSFPQESKERPAKPSNCKRHSKSSKHSACVKARKRSKSSKRKRSRIRRKS